MVRLELRVGVAASRDDVLEALTDRALMAMGGANGQH
jgi:hypothetical protein